MSRATRIRVSLLLVITISALGGCGTSVYEARFSRAMKVLEHEMQRQAAVDLHWSDEDWVNEAGDVVRPSTGVSYSLPNQLRIELNRDEWPGFPAFVPYEYVLAVYAGELPKQDENQPGDNPLVRCYILAEKAEEQDSAAAPADQGPVDADEAEEQPKEEGLALHQSVKEAWEQVFGEGFEPAQITQPTQADYGPQRRFDVVRHEQPGEDTVILYLFPASVDDSSTHQVAIYFHILEGPAEERELQDNIALSLETLSAGTTRAPASGPGGIVF